MITYNMIKNKPYIFKSFTGMTVTEFQTLLPSFERAYETHLAKMDEERKKPRQRQRGGGCKGVLRTSADKLLFILFYFKFYPVQVVQGFIFGSQSTPSE